MLTFVVPAPLLVCGVLDFWITAPYTRYAYCCSPEGKNKARCAGLCSVTWFCTNLTIPVLVVLVSIIRKVVQHPVARNTYCSRYGTVPGYVVHRRLHFSNFTCNPNPYFVRIVRSPNITMTMTRPQQSGQASCSRIWLVGRSLLVGILYLMAILTIHVRADVPNGVAATTSASTEASPNSLSFADRLQQGPNGLTIIDLLFFGAIVMLGFEIMSFLALHTGEWISAKRIPVRGKHLDDLTMVSLKLKVQ